MNNLRKKAALKNYAEQIRALNNNEDAVAFLLEREEKYKADEIVEIIAASMAGEDSATGEGENNAPGAGGNTPEENNNEPAAPPPPKETFTKHTGGLIRFEKFKVKPVYEQVVIPGEGKKRILKAYEKTGDCLQVTHIEQKHADILNQQVVNSMLFFFKEGDASSIDPTLYF